VDGEFIPRKDISDIHVVLSEKASYRHRGICIEGADCYENIADMIDWMPKLGFNSYFIQFREAYIFFERWYTHRNNPGIEAEEFSVEKARVFVSEIIKEMKKRGLLFHAVGHGWTCEPFGMQALGWDKTDYEVRPEIREHLAEEYTD